MKAPTLLLLIVIALCLSPLFLAFLCVVGFSAFAHWATKPDKGD